MIVDRDRGVAVFGRLEDKSVGLVGGDAPAVITKAQGMGDIEIAAENSAADHILGLFLASVGIVRARLGLLPGLFSFLPVFLIFFQISFFRPFGTIPCRHQHPAVPDPAFDIGGQVLLEAIAIVKGNRVVPLGKYQVGIIPQIHPLQVGQVDPGQRHLHAVIQQVPDLAGVVGADPGAGHQQRFDRV